MNTKILQVEATASKSGKLQHSSLTDASSMLMCVCTPVGDKSQVQSQAGRGEAHAQLRVHLQGRRLTHVAEGLDHRVLLTGAHAEHDMHVMSGYTRRAPAAATKAAWPNSVVHLVCCNRRPEGLCCVRKHVPEGAGSCGASTATPILCIGSCAAQKHWTEVQMHAMCIEELPRHSPHGMADAAHHPGTRVQSGSSSHGVGLAAPPGSHSPSGSTAGASPRIGPQCDAHYRRRSQRAGRISQTHWQEKTACTMLRVRQKKESVDPSLVQAFCKPAVYGAGI